MNKCILIILFFSSLNLYSEEIIQAIDKDTKIGVSGSIAEINIHTGEKKDPISSDIYGCFTEKKCFRNNCYYEYVPDDQNYWHIPKIKYPFENNKILVQRKGYVMNLENNYQNALNNNYYGKAALISVDLSIRYKDIDINKSKYYENMHFKESLLALENYFKENKNEKTLKDISKIKVESDWFKNTGELNNDFKWYPAEIIINEDYEKIIELYQKEKGLGVNGKLNYATMEALSTQPISDFIFKKNIIKNENKR